MPTLRLGTDDFLKYRQDGGYLIDKSLLIRRVLDGSDVLLLPRPRRFGKTFNLSMLRYFFEKGGEDRSGLFADLAIAGDADAMRHLGRYPTLYINLKDVRGDDWETALAKLRDQVSRIYRAHEVVRDGLPPEQRARFDALCAQTSDRAALDLSLRDLILDLHRFHGRPVVVLIDEYDSPVIEAHAKGYYDRMIDFMRAWLGGGLKHEYGPALFRAVVTGILRVARESIFSGLNNLTVWSMLAAGPFEDQFGFTEAEVGTLLQAFGLEGRMPVVRDWYNGYRFGGSVVYNPWSVLNYVQRHPAPPAPYWLNTSSPALIHEELAAGGMGLRRDLEKLLSGEELRHPIQENIVFSEIRRNHENIWSFLAFSGYLRAEDPQPDPRRPTRMLYRLSIPNREVEEAFHSFVDRYYDEGLRFGALGDLLSALEGDDVPAFERLLSELVGAVFSYHDTGAYPEAVYHAFLLGILVNLRGSYRVVSNAETGYGRADILMFPRRAALTGKVIELKSLGSGAEMEQGVSEALAQIEARDYGVALREAGVASARIRKYAVVVCGKRVIVRQG